MTPTRNTETGEVDDDYFFPDRGKSNAVAMSACFSCGVRQLCKDYQERTNTRFGVWGGELQTREDSSDSEIL